jgi:hypothetical protein
MAIQHFNRLAPKPITVSTPSSHQSDFGFYVARKYSAYGNTFDRVQGDAQGRSAAGAYGWCTEEGAAWAWRMQDYAKKHDLQSDFFDAATFAAIKKDLDAGRAVALSTQLTSAGHIIAIKGYTDDGKLIANDPWGNKTLGTYPNATGADALYAWSYVSAKWNINVHGEITKLEPAHRAEIVAVTGPSPVAVGATTTAVIALKNTGTAAWDDQTFLGTTEPRDRESAFFVDGTWAKPNRVGPLPATAPGQSATIDVLLRAPAVTEAKTFTECFGVLQEGSVWFADEGGPKDDAICLRIEVRPAATAPAPPPEEPPPQTNPPPPPPDDVDRVAHGGCALGSDGATRASEAAIPFVLALFFVSARTRPRARCRSGRRSGTAGRPERRTAL